MMKLLIKVRVRNHKVVFKSKKSNNIDSINRF